MNTSQSFDIQTKRLPYIVHMRSAVLWFLLLKEIILAAVLHCPWVLNILFKETLEIKNRVRKGSLSASIKILWVMFSQIFHKIQSEFSSQLQLQKCCEGDYKQWYSFTIWKTHLRWNVWYIHIHLFSVSFTKSNRIVELNNKAWKLSVPFHFQDANEASSEICNPASTCWF